MRRLVHEHAAALAVPRPAPRIGRVVGLVAPAEEVDGREHRASEPAGVDRGLHAHDGRIEAPLADHAEPDAGRSTGVDRPVAVGQRGRERLLNQDVDAVLRRDHDRGGVGGMRGAHAQDLDPLLAQHGREVGVRPDPEWLGEGGRTGERPVADRDEVRRVEGLQRGGMRLPHLAAPNERRSQSHTPPSSQARSTAAAPCKCRVAIALG